jgi:hypothetical protein
MVVKARTLAPGKSAAISLGGTVCGEDEDEGRSYKIAARLLDLADSVHPSLKMGRLRGRNVCCGRIKDTSMRRNEERGE